MHKIKLLFIGLIGILFSINVYAKESVFDPTVKIEYENNIANILIGYKGEKIDTITNKIAYLKNDLTLIGQTQLEDFSLIKMDEKKENNFNIIDISAKSETLYDDTNYILLTFEIKENVKETIIYLYDYIATSSYDYYKYKSSGLNITIKKEETGYIDYIKENNKNTKITYYFKQYISYVLIGIFGLILVVILIIIILPNKRKKENRELKLKNKINNSNNVIIKENKFNEDMMEDISDNKKTETKDIPKDGLITINSVDFNEVKDEEDSL